MHAYSNVGDVEAVGTANQMEDNVVLLYKAQSLIWWSPAYFFPVFAMELTTINERIYLIVASDKLYFYELDKNAQPFRSFSFQVSRPAWGVTHICAWGNLLLARSGAGCLHVLRVDGERITELETMFGGAGDSCAGLICFPQQVGLLGVLLEASKQQENQNKPAIEQHQIKLRLYKPSFASPQLRRLAEFDVPGLPHSVSVFDSRPGGFGLVMAGKKRIYAYRFDMAADSWAYKVSVPADGCFAAVRCIAGTLYAAADQEIIKLRLEPEAGKQTEPEHITIPGVSNLAVSTTADCIALGMAGAILLK